MENGNKNAQILQTQSQQDSLAPHWSLATNTIHGLISTLIKVALYWI